METRSVATVSLRDMLDSHAELPPARICRIAAQIAHEFASLHSHGELHGPLDAADVHITPATDAAVLGRGARSSAVDDEAATQVDDRVDDGGSADGAEASQACDLYAFGALLYEVCCGVPPGDGERGPFGAPARPDGIPEPLWCVIEGLLDPDPEHRPRSADEVAAQLSVLAVTLVDEDVAPRLRPAHGPAQEGLPDESPSAAGEGSETTVAARVTDVAEAPERIFSFTSDDPVYEPRRSLRSRLPRRAARSIESVDTEGAAERGKTAEPVESDGPVKSVRPVKATKPVKPVKSTRPVKSARTVKAAKSVRPAKSTEPVRPGSKLAQPVQSTKPARPKSAKSAKPVKSTKPAKAAGPSKPAGKSVRPEAAKPVEAARRPSTRPGVEPRARSVRTVIGLVLLGVVSFGLTWGLGMMNSARDEKPPARVQVEQSSRDGGPIRTIEPAVVVGAGGAGAGADMAGGGMAGKPGVPTP